MFSNFFSVQPLKLLQHTTWTQCKWYHLSEIPKVKSSTRCLLAHRMKPALVNALRISRLPERDKGTELEAKAIVLQQCGLQYNTLHEISKWSGCVFILLRDYLLWISVAYLAKFVRLAPLASGKSFITKSQKNNNTYTLLMISDVHAS